MCYNLIMHKIHSYLSKNYTYYQNWHNNVLHAHIHWAVFFVFVLMTGFFSLKQIETTDFSLIVRVERAHASGTPISSPISFWKLDETSGARVDSVGSNNLQDNGNPSQLPGKINSAIHLSLAGTQYLNIPDNSSLSTGDTDFTFAGWVKADDLTTYRVVASKRNSSSNGEWLLLYDPVIKNFKFYTYNGTTATGGVAASSLGQPTTNTWYYIVAWRDKVAKTVNIQVNNGAVDTAIETGIPADSTADFKIGYTYSPSTAWAGDIDEVGFWKKVLSTTERTALYNNGTGWTYTNPISISIATRSNAQVISGTQGLDSLAYSLYGLTIQSVKFYLDNQYLGDGVRMDYNNPDNFYYPINTANFPSGPHTLKAVGEDTIGNTNSVSIDVIFDNTPPTVSISSPSSGSSISEPYSNISINATDNLSLKNVKFYIDGELIRQDDAAPYNFRFYPHGISQGSHVFTAMAEDMAGNKTTSSPVSATINASSASLSPVLKDVRSVTYYSVLGTTTTQVQGKEEGVGCDPTYIEGLEKELPKIKANGFNTVWLVPFMECFATQTLSPQIFKEDSFAQLRQVLGLIQSYNMKAILPLDYISSFSSPSASVSVFDILKYKDASGNPVGYWAIRDYTSKFLSEIENYNKDVVVMIFTENLIDVSRYPYSSGPNEPARVLRETVGRLPLDLPSALRNKFIIGFHDFIFRWSEPAPLTSLNSPLPLPNPYDFMSYAYYITNTALPINDMDMFSSRLKDYFGSSTKIFHGELGVSDCDFTQSQQLSLWEKTVGYPLGRFEGFNVWEWSGQPICSREPVFRLNDNLGQPLPMLDLLKNMMVNFTSDAISYWKFEESSGNRNDAIGSNNLRDNGGVTRVSGKVGGSSHFSSAGTQYLSIADNPSLSTGDTDFAITAWVRAEDLSTYRVIASKRNSSSNGEWLLLYDPVIKNFKFYTYNGATTVGGVAASSFGQPSVNTWYYIVAWRDKVAKTVNIQVNNGPINSAVETGVPADSTADFKIGYTYAGTTAWVGDIDEVTFWKKILNSSQKTLMYNSSN